MSTRRAALLRAGQTPLEPLHVTATGGTHADTESHQHAVDSRCQSEPTDHLDRAWPGTDRGSMKQVAADMCDERAVAVAHTATLGWLVERARRSCADSRAGHCRGTR